MTRTYKSLEEYKAALAGKRLAPTAPREPLDRLFGAYGWWWTNEIQEFEEKPGKALPTTARISDVVEARAKAREGWRPIQDRDVPDEVVDLLVSFYDGKLPAALESQLSERLAARKPAASPAPAPHQAPAPRR